MCKKLMLLSCLVTLLGLSNIAFAAELFEIFKVDFSCPPEQDPEGVTKKGGSWEDFEFNHGCDGDEHDGRWGLVDAGGTGIDVYAGRPSGNSNLMSRDGDPISNTSLYFVNGGCGDMELGLRYLDPCTTYTVYTYHAWDEGDINSVKPVTVVGADSNLVINIPGVVDTISDAELLASPNVGEIQFTTDPCGSVVRIIFNGCTRFNAFALHSEVALSKASSPNPSNAETDVCPNDVQLSWKPGAETQTMAGHDVYFDPNFNDVAEANRASHAGVLYYSEGQDSNEYPEDGDPCLKLELMTTYYWRVDEINDTNIWTSSIWSFTTEDGNARDPDPVIGFVGLNPDANVLSWTPSCVAAAQTVYFSADFNDVNTMNPTAIEDDTLSGTDNNVAPTLAKFTTYYWRIETTRSGAYGTGASEVWSFSTGLGGLLLYLPFEGIKGTNLPETVLDDSGNDLDFTTYAAIYDSNASGSVKYADGHRDGNSAVFDPNAGLYRLDTGELNPLRLDGWQYSIQFWVKPERLDADMDIDDDDPNEDWLDEDFAIVLIGKFNSWMIGIQGPGDNNEFEWDLGNSETEGDAVVGEWTHLTVVYDRTLDDDQLWLYVNGELESDVDAGPRPSDNNYPVTIGYAYKDDVNMGRYFEGCIDELRIWDIVVEPILEFATQPYPENGSRGLDPNDPNVAKFMWKPGVSAANVDGHNIYFGTSIAHVNESADPCEEGWDSNSWTHEMTFEKGKTYYWRVDEANGADLWTGAIWKFQMKADLIDPNIVVYYPLDETSGDDVPDYSGRYFEADCDNAPHWEPDNGRFGGCMHFSMEWEWDEDDEEWGWGNSEPGNIETESDYGAQAADLINKEISISVWVNGDPNQRSESGEDMVVFEFCDEDYDDGIDGEPDSTKIFAIVPTGPAETGDVVFRAGIHPADTLKWKGFEPMAARGTWQHFVFIKNDNDANMYIYLNAELVATKDDCNGTSLADVVGSGDATLKLGAYVDNSSDYHGRLDEFQIYNKQLSEQEIEKIHRGGELGPAWSPSPYDGQGNVFYDTDLTWKPGAYADSHDVFFGTNWDDISDVNSSNYASYPNVDYNHTDACSYDPCGLLEFGQTYYWRVDEVNDACDPNGWRGRIWRFTVASYIVIDDFEKYDVGDASAQPGSWEDGTEDPYETGSGIEFGDLGWGPEWVRSGKMSMWFWYDNDFGGTLGKYSEATTEALSPTDWASFVGLKVLTLWFYGDPDNAATDLEQMYVGLNTGDANAYVDYGEGEGEDMNDIQIEAWQRWDIPLSSFDVNRADVEKLIIGFGIRGGGTPGGLGTVYFDDIRLRPAFCDPVRRPLEGDLNGDCAVGFEDVEIMAIAWLDSDCNCVEEYGEMPPPQGDANLVAWYEFNTGSGDTATDSSSNPSNGYDGTISVNDVNVFWTAPGFDDTGYALEFTGGWVSVPNGPTKLNLTDAVTVSCWINLAESADDSMQVVCKGRNDQESYRLEIGDDYQGLKWGVRDPNKEDYDLESERPLPTDAWLHIAGTYDGNCITSYVNARLEMSEPNGGFQLYTDANDGMGIGERPGDLGDEDDWYPFIGTIDDVRIYDYGLSGAEICYIASDGDGVVEMFNIANIHVDTPEGTKQAVNFKDFAKLANNWLDVKLWPE